MTGVMSFSADAYIVGQYPLCFSVFYYLAIEKHVDQSRRDIMEKLFGITGQELSDSAYHHMIKGWRGIGEDRRVIFCRLCDDQVAERLQAIEIDDCLKSTRTVLCFIKDGILTTDDEKKKEFPVEDPLIVNEGNCMFYMAKLLKAAVSSRDTYVLTKKDQSILENYLLYYNKLVQEKASYEKERVEILFHLLGDIYVRLVMLLKILNCYSESSSECTAEMILSLAEEYNIETIEDLDQESIEDILYRIMYNEILIYGSPVPLPVYNRYLGSKKDIIAKLKKESEIQDAILKESEKQESEGQ